MSLHQSVYLMIIFQVTGERKRMCELWKVRDVVRCVTNKMDQNVVIENIEPLFAFKNDARN